MLKKISCITLLILLIIEIHNVDCFNGRRLRRTIKKVSPNCIDRDHLGNCVDLKRTQSLTGQIVKKNASPKSYMKV